MRSHALLAIFIILNFLFEWHIAPIAHKSVDELAENTILTIWVESSDRLFDRNLVAVAV